MGWRVWHCALPYRWAPLSFQMEESATPNIVWRLLVMRSWKFHFCGKPRQNIVQVAWLPAYLYDYCHFDIFLFTSLWISGKKLIIIVIITDNFYIALFSSLQRLTAIYICSCAILGMHQKFFDTWYYWTHQTKVGGGGERIIFFHRILFQHLHNGMCWNHLLHWLHSSDFSPGWFGRVFNSLVYGTLKNVSLQLFFSLHFLGIGRCCRERGLASVVSVTAAALCFCWEKLTIVAAVCALALSWRPQNPVFGRCWHYISKTFRRQ